MPQDLVLTDINTNDKNRVCSRRYLCLTVFFLSFYFLWLCCVCIYRKQGKFQTARHAAVLRTAVLLGLKKGSLKLFFYKINVNSKYAAVMFPSTVLQ